MGDETATGTKEGWLAVECDRGGVEEGMVEEEYIGKEEGDIVGGTTVE